MVSTSRFANFHNNKNSRLQSRNAQESTSNLFKRFDSHTARFTRIRKCLDCRRGQRFQLCVLTAQALGTGVPSASPRPSALHSPESLGAWGQRRGQERELEEGSVSVSLHVTDQLHSLPPGSAKSKPRQPHPSRRGHQNPRCHSSGYASIDPR